MTPNEQKAFWLACVAAYSRPYDSTDYHNAQRAVEYADAKLSEAIKRFGDGRQST